MRLTLPEPNINIGEDGFDEHCKLGRAETGRKLSELIEKIEDPIVIALDGSWGSGKSFFLKCWTGAHQKENKGTKVIYFDAFKHDFLDNPLIALTGALSLEFSEPKGVKKTINTTKKTAARLALPALRIAAALATSGASEIVGVVAEKGLHAASNEITKASEAFWEKEEGRIAAMEQFRQALTELTQPIKEGADPQKIVIIVDELDRCRPDYALSMLEVMKHFFAVDNVHFVLGVNLNALESSVHARYGEGIDASVYLQKFMHVVMPLVEPKPFRTTTNAGAKYFRHLAAHDSFRRCEFAGYIQEVLDAMPHGNQVSLRQANRIMSKALVTPCPSHNRLVEFVALVCLIVLDTIKPEWITRIQDEQLDLKTINNFFGLVSADKNNSDQTRHELYWLWQLALDPQFVPTGYDRQHIAFEQFHQDANKRRQLLPHIIDTYLSAFQLPR